MKTKPCPHCGKSGKCIELWESFPGNKYHYECPNCYWCGRQSRIKFVAKLNWNRGKIYEVTEDK